MKAAQSLRRCIHCRQSPIEPFYLDFLAPRLLARQQPLRPACTAAPRTAKPEFSRRESSTASKPKYVLTPSQRAYLSSALRVNQAGELAATLIYTAQTPPILQRHPDLRQLMSHMHAQEAGHFSTFNSLLFKHRIRPTAMYPIWQLTATALGWSTGLMGREAAMACTEAVETEIGTHYNGQVRVLLEWIRGAEGRGEEVDGEVRELVSTLKRIRDEELEHLDRAVENDAKNAKPYEALTNVIRYGCRGAIWISERI